MKERYKRFIFTCLLPFTLLSLALIISTAFRYNNDNSLNLLAAQFLKGHISLNPDNTLPVGDISTYNGKFYMYFGPLASIMLMPFIAVFGITFPQIFIGIFSLITSFYAIFALSRKFLFSIIDSLWLSLFFVFSTVLFSTSAINITSYLVEALGVPLILLSFLAYFSKKKRPVLVGLLLGLAVLTRVTLILAITFFIVEFLKKRLTKKELFTLFMPLIACCLLLAAYNYLRFDSFIETGYNHHIENPFPLSENFAYGQTHLIHLPANLYAFFIKPPEVILHNENGYVLKFPYFKADPWGMAIWFTSPLFFLLLFNFKKNKYFLSSFTALIAIALPIFTFFSVGFAQFGYRYALDFLPFLFLLLIPCLKPKLTHTAIILIILGIVFNCLYITSLWDVYPHFGINK